MTSYTMIREKFSFKRFGARALHTAGLVALLALTGCAGLFGAGDKPGSVTVAPNERLLLRVEPFGPAAITALQRAGVEPADLQREFEAELRYVLYARGQEEALDTASATVVLTLSVDQWQPGFGNSGTYAAFVLQSQRIATATKNAGVDLPASERGAWTWQARAKDNAPPTYAIRHMARLAAREVGDRIVPPKKDTEPPPPLHLMR